MNTEEISKLAQPNPVNAHQRSNADAPAVIVFPPALLLGTLMLGLVLGLLWPMRLLPASSSATWAQIVGAVMVVFGAVLMIWGRTTMVRSGTNVNPGEPTLAIVTDGPFRFTRNPLYLGGTIVYLGLGVGINSAWLMVLFAPMILLLHWGIIRREEGYLEAKFGDIYLNYKAHVRRWL
jgi:protein-S-isoprenylcysteine O-methyltransferase Ste14